MKEIDLVAKPTSEEIHACKTVQPSKFKGNLEDLARLYRVVNTLPRSSERHDALTRWSAFNTTKSDSAFNEMTGQTRKVSYREVYRELDLRGLTFDGSTLGNSTVIGPIDLRGTDLRGASFLGVQLTKAMFDFADLRGGKFENCCLRSATFRSTRLRGTTFKDCLMGFTSFRDAVGTAKNGKSARFEGADLQGADLSEAEFRGASFQGANLQAAQLLETDLRGADLSGCQVFGAAVWSPIIDANTMQRNLLVTPAKPLLSINDRGQWRNAVDPQAPIPPMRTDSLAHAHLIYLMLNPDLSELLQSVTTKGVLLLGRFSGEHGEVLDALRIALRNEGYLPLKFDFRKPGDRTLKETVLTLAGLCRFIVADITEASSIPLELITIVKDYKIPVVPIQRKGRHTFSMFESIEQEFRDRILQPLEYVDQEDLLKVLKGAIIERAIQRSNDLCDSKSVATEPVSTAEFTGEADIATSD